MLENSRKIAIFFGFTINREKREENSLHKEDKIAIFALFVLRSIALKFWLVTW